MKVLHQPCRPRTHDESVSTFEIPPVGQMGFLQPVLRGMVRDWAVELSQRGFDGGRYGQDSAGSN